MFLSLSLVYIFVLKLEIKLILKVIQVFGNDLYEY